MLINQPDIARYAVRVSALLSTILLEVSHHLIVV